jgi:transcriptional regulator with XRE-family HTH domain
MHYDSFTMQAGRQLEMLMAARGLTQEAIANEAGVSQATVSRTLRRQPQRSGAAYLRLCSYIQQQSVAAGAPGAPAVAFEAVRRVWDGSERHAAALGELINASGQLWPALNTSEDCRSPAQTNSASD